MGNTRTPTASPRSASVHPHGCGEYDYRIGHGRYFFGSSPRVWGILFANTKTRSFSRFIPTGVGNTFYPARRLPRLSVHPHGCGEYEIVNTMLRELNGSSPRVWGIPLDLFETDLPRRFIPTGVGNTSIVMYFLRPQTVHPHGCGEYQRRRIAFTIQHGSSPRVWGILRNNTRNFLHWRFIPTGVGNTTPDREPMRAYAVHPHGCGEYNRSSLRRPEIYGSSPRVWGIQKLQRLPRFPDRFIPTGVGNTSPRTHPQIRQTVHPHGCGEYMTRTVAGSVRTGSSPRVWGIQLVRRLEHLTPRFIPTGVGNTHSLCTNDCICPVHPHGCGEYQLITVFPSSDTGSSPRVWGILPLPSPVNRICRFIPTGVGNTLAQFLKIAGGDGSSPRVWGIQFIHGQIVPHRRFIPTGVGNTGLRL